MLKLKRRGDMCLQLGHQPSGLAGTPLASVLLDATILHRAAQMLHLLDQNLVVALPTLTVPTKGCIVTFQLLNSFLSY